MNLHDVPEDDLLLRFFRTRWPDYIWTVLPNGLYHHTRINNPDSSYDLAVNESDREEAERWLRTGELP